MSVVRMQEEFLKLKMNKVAICEKIKVCLGRTAYCSNIIVVGKLVNKAEMAG